MFRKKIFFILIATVLTFSLFGCSSKKKDSGEDVATAEEITDADLAGDEDGEELSDDAEVADLENDDLEPTEEGEAEEDGEEVAEADGEDDEFGDEDDLDDEESMDEEVAEEGESSEDEIVAEEGDEDSMDEEVADSESESEGIAEPSDDPMDEPVEVAAEEDPSGMGMGEEMADEEPVKKWVSVKKIKTTIFRRSGVLANAVYLARPGDDLSSVSQKIYGVDRTEDLLKVGPHLARGLKTGDKVYYNSPQRPADENQLLNFYEDAGLQPEIYVSQSGDNIRAVSKKLLGDAHSWKEVWATNMDVESKGELPEGTQLRYWASSVNIAAAAPTPEPAPAPEEMAPPPEPEPMADEPPPVPEQTIADNEMPPPPAPSMDDPPPPPPAMGSMEPPPPPPPPRPAARPKKAKVSAGKGLLDDPDQTMALAAGVVLLIAAILLFIIIRKKRAAKSLDFHTATHTQID